MLTVCILCQSNTKCVNCIAYTDRCCANCVKSLGKLLKVLKKIVMAIVTNCNCFNEFSHNLQQNSCSILLFLACSFIMGLYYNRLNSAEMWECMWLYYKLSHTHTHTHTHTCHTLQSCSITLCRVFSLSWHNSISIWVDAFIMTAGMYSVSLCVCVCVCECECECEWERERERERVCNTITYMCVSPRLAV